MHNSFAGFNQQFDKTFVLTLPRLAERRAHVQKVLSGLDFEIFYGVDKAELSVKEAMCNNLFDIDGYRTFYKHPSSISSGMLCCALGHLRIYEEIVHHQYECTLILEDDILPQYDNLPLLSAIIAELPLGWDVLYLGYEKQEQFGFREWLNLQIKKIYPYHTQLFMTRKLFKSFYARPFGQYISRAGFHDCTHAYVVSLEGAKKLLACGRPVRFHPDNLLSWMIGHGLLNGYIARTKLFNQQTAFVHERDSLTSS